MTSLRRWAGVLGAPMIWFAQMTIAYALVPSACSARSAMPEHLVFAIALVLTAGAGLLSWRERRHFLGSLGMLTSAFMFTVIAAQWIPVFVFHPCTGLLR